MNHLIDWVSGKDGQFDAFQCILRLEERSCKQNIERYTTFFSQKPDISIIPRFIYNEGNIISRMNSEAIN